MGIIGVVCCQYNVPKLMPADLKTMLSLILYPSGSRNIEKGHSPVNDGTFILKMAKTFCWYIQSNT